MKKKSFNLPLLIFNAMNRLYKLKLKSFGIDTNIMLINITPHMRSHNIKCCGLMNRSPDEILDS